jgi:WD repeat-containing protein 23
LWENSYKAAGMNLKRELYMILLARVRGFCFLKRMPNLAHDDDINAVCFGDDGSHILLSGADDGLVKVWDRRTMGEFGCAKPVGVFAGHRDGITFIDSRGDDKYFLSNSKDQTIKVWDIRHFSTETGIVSTLN